MSQGERVTVTVSDEMATAMRYALEGGEYASADDIVGEALRDWAHKRVEKQRDVEVLNRLFREGQSNGTAAPATDRQQRDVDMLSGFLLKDAGNGAAVPAGDPELHDVDVLSRLVRETGARAAEPPASDVLSELQHLIAERSAARE